VIAGAEQVGEDLPAVAGRLDHLPVVDDGGGLAGAEDVRDEDEIFEVVTPPEDFAAVKDRLVAKGYRFGTLKRAFSDYFEMVYFDMAGFEGGTVALNCALEGIRPERLVFASDYPQDFTGVNTDTGKGMTELRNYIETIRKLPLGTQSKEDILGGTAARLLKL